jgi:TonB-linked SusC/RagA family outer membrane protein
MRLVRYSSLAIVGFLFWSVHLGAQGPTGVISGRAVDSLSQQPLAGVNVLIEGTEIGTITRDNGGYLLPGVPAGTHTVRAIRIGYAPESRTVTVIAGETATADFALQTRATVLTEMVVTGYGSQRREAITGSVAEVNADDANVGVITNANDMIEGRVAGVQMTENSGEPGAGAQFRIRGGTSISASNEPLYVIDGVPINNVETESSGIGVGGSPSLPRSPLNLINPSDIESIVILKDASATAIYGSRGANGVVLIETKKGVADRPGIEYDSYVAMASPANYLDVLNGDQYRQFIQEQVDAGVLQPDRLTNLGTANTNWERAVTRTAVTHNHNVSFSGGGEATRYRASLNYMDQQGVVLESGFQRLQGRLNGAHAALNDRLRLNLNLTASHIENDYLTFENTGGFEGGVFNNVATFNPTHPIRVTDSTGATAYYEAGLGRQSLRNPVALAEQIADFGTTTRTLGNMSAELDLFPGLTFQVNLGADHTEGTRRTYFPLSSPVGAEWQGRAQQVNRDNTNVTLQTYLTYRREINTEHSLDILGGYEFNDYDLGEFGAESRGFLFDATGYHNLGGGAELVRPFSFRQESRLISFFSRANYGFKDRYFLTGVVRYDGSSRFGEGNKWSVFPALSASWRIIDEAFMRDNTFFSDLRLRAGVGLQGNQGVAPYGSLILLEPSGGARYVFGETPVVGVAPVSNPNPNLKWEETTQYNVGIDYAFRQNRFSGTLEYYVKNTDDLLLTVPVPQPAPASQRLENVGSVRNTGIEFSFDANLIAQPDLNWGAGLVFARERNEVVGLGLHSSIATGSISGQGQSGTNSQRILPGQPLGTFWGPTFVGVNDEGKQLFACSPAGTGDTLCVNGQTTSPRGDDFGIIGNANPDFTIGFRSHLNWGKFDASMLVRADIGRDVFNNTALVYATQSNALQDKNFLESALSDPTDIHEPAIFSSRWIEDGSFARLQNLTVGYTFNLPLFGGLQPRTARVYVSGDNLLLLTGYSGLDPEVHAEAGLASRGIDYLAYPRARTFTAGTRLAF